MRRALARGLAAGLLLLTAASAAPAGTVSSIRIDGAINPAVADHVKTSIEAARELGAVALVIELDTPGGLVSSTKDIVTSILNAPLPVVVYVAPRGAWAASAGTFITLAGHVAAMSPGSTIGAAHPVTIGGENPKPEESDEKDEKGRPKPRHRDYMGEKMENFTTAFIEAIAAERQRNVEWAAEAVRNSVAIGAKEALQKKVIDLIADDTNDLLEKIDGRTVVVGKDKVALQTKDAAIAEIPMSFVNQVFAVLADPQIVGLLFLLGVLGIYIEFQNPGLVLPGALGVVAILLAATALQIIPFNWVGVLLVLGGIALLIAEVHVSSFGLLFALGLAALAWGAWLTFHVPELSDLSLPFWRAVVPVAVAVAVVITGVAFSVSRAQGRPEYAGVEALVHETGVAYSDLDPMGRVRVRGELWNARADGPVRKGDEIEVVAVEDLVLHVRPRAARGGGS